jgi:uncharacterized membrane protein YkoI
MSETTKTKKTTNRTNRLLIGAAAAVGVLAGAAGISAAVTGDDGSDPTPAIAREEAEAAALAEVPGTVRRAHLEREDGGLEWDVDVDGEDGRRHDVQVDADTGEVLEHDTDD